MRDALAHTRPMFSRERVVAGPTHFFAINPHTEGAERMSDDLANRLATWGASRGYGRANGGRGVRILVACEFSGTVRRAFAALGHDAWSVDLLPSEDRSNKHIIAAILSAIMGVWVGVAVASALPPRSFVNTFGPLIVVLIVAAISGGV